MALGLLPMALGLLPMALGLLFDTGRSAAHASPQLPYFFLMAQQGQRAGTAAIDSSNEQPEPAPAMSRRRGSARALSRHLTYGPGKRRPGRHLEQRLLSLRSAPR